MENVQTALTANLNSACIEFDTLHFPAQGTQFDQELAIATADVQRLAPAAKWRRIAIFQAPE